MLKSLFGIHLKQKPVLGLMIMLVIITIQLLNKFVYYEKKPKAIENFYSIQEKAREYNAGFASPFFQAAAADMFTQEGEYNTKRIMGIVIYYLFVLTGLLLGESVLGHFNLIMLVIIGIMVEYLTKAMIMVSCYQKETALVGGEYCCGQYFAWFMCGVTSAILFNYHFLKTKKVTTFIFGLMFLALGFGILMYQKYFIGMPSGLDSDEKTSWCVAATQSTVPYLLGGMTSMGAMGLLFTKVPGA